MRFPARPLSLPTFLSGFSRRRQTPKDGQEPPTDPAQEAPAEDEQGGEVVEPQPEPVPSARDEFHQAYTKKLQAADKDIEDYLKTLDSVSYPVRSRFFFPPDQFPHTSGSARLCYLRLSSYFSLIANPNLAQRVRRWLDVILLAPLLIRSHPSGFYGISAAVLVISLSLFAKQYLKYRSSQEHRRLSSTKKRGSSTAFTWLTEGGVPLVALAVLSPFLLSQILSKAGRSLYATLSIIAAAFFILGFVFEWGPALLHTLVTKIFHPRSPSHAPRNSRPTSSPLPKQSVASFSSAPGGGEAQDSTASLTVAPILNPVGVDHQGNLTDARRLAWTIDGFSDSGTVSTILQFILEILWTPALLQDADSSSATLARSHELLLEAFDNDYANQPLLLSGMRAQAFAAAKAFIHVFIQGEYTPDDPVIRTIRDRHLPLGSASSLQDDADLRSAVGIVDNLLGIRSRVQWAELQLTSSHRLWLSHILLYRAWYATKRGLPIPNEVTGFVKHSLSSDSRPRLAVVTDCVLVVGLIVGHPLHEADLLVLEKTWVSPFLHLTCRPNRTFRLKPRTPVDSPKGFQQVKSRVRADLNAGGHRGRIQGSRAFLPPSSPPCRGWLPSSFW